MKDIELKALMSMAGFAILVILGLMSSEYRRSGNAAGAVAAMIGRLFRKKQAARSEHHGLKITAGSRLATVFAEASFDPERKTGSWGVWARCGTQALKRAGQFPERIHTRDHAALAAVGQAVKIAVQEFDLGGGDTVLAQSASEHAVDVLSGRLQLRENRVDEHTILDQVKKLENDHRIHLAFRHLHDPGGDSSRRTQASIMCEQAAERELERIERAS
jgi:ribonuclease HI